VTEFDFVVLAILLVSSLVGLLRGLLKEILALLAYGVAIVVTLWWGATVYGWLMPWIKSALLRMGVAYATVFFLALLGMGLLNMGLSTLIQKSGMSSMDHGMGAMFGFIRGLLIVFLLVEVAGYTPLPQEPWWRHAMFSHGTVEAIKYSKAWLPPNLAALVPY
jgi:membrane protein required for colicin V production